MNNLILILALLMLLACICFVCCVIGFILLNQNSTSNQTQNDQPSNDEQTYDNTDPNLNDPYDPSLEDPSVEPGNVDPFGGTTNPTPTTPTPTPTTTDKTAETLKTLINKYLNSDEKALLAIMVINNKKSVIQIANQPLIFVSKIASIAKTNKKIDPNDFRDLFADIRNAKLTDSTITSYEGVKSGSFIIPK